jgi:hypothetical protein
MFNKHKVVFLTSHPSTPLRMTILISAVTQSGVEG